MLACSPVSASRFLAASTRCASLPPRIAGLVCLSHLSYRASVHEISGGHGSGPSRLSSVTQPRRAFHSSRVSSSDSEPQQTYYEVLDISPDTSKADLKKQFYVLSKETHPDRHRDDPTAGERFAKISEAYSVLGNDEKRRRYDRDVMRPLQQRAARRDGGNGANTGGTYAGSRAPTGLSKRRGTFRGPPPSFYAHGSANNTQQQQKQQQAEADRMQGAFNASAFTEPGQWDPAFNPDPTYRTQTAEDRRRGDRRAAALAAAQANAEEEGNFWGRFVVVSGVVFLGVSVGSLVVGMSNTSHGGMTRSDGSRRNGPRNEWTKS